MPEQGRLGPGRLEAAAMETLWDRGGWLTPREVHGVLRAERPLAYTTVMTVLGRLCKKGLLQRRRLGRGYA